MTILTFVDRRGRLLAAAAIAASLISGAASAALIALVNHALTRRGAVGLLAAGFAALLVAKVGSNMLAQLLLNHFAQRTITRLIADLSRKVLGTPLRRLEQVGIPRLLTALTDDVTTISFATNLVPSLIMNAAILSGCAVYLAWLSWPVLVAVVGLVVVGSAIYRALAARAFRHMQHARDTRETLFRHFRTLTEGIKELKIHGARRRAFLVQCIDPTLATFRQDWIAAIRHHVVASGWSQFLFYGMLGALLFTIPMMNAITIEALTGYVLVTLYMMNPLWSLMGSWPVLARGRIALDKVRDLGLSLSGPDTIDEDTPPPSQALERLDVEGVVFAYEDEADGPGFVLGPLDFSLRRGELVFLVGGNGSGKSTLMKVLTGLYPPTMGVIRFNGHVLDESSRLWYRQHFSAIFSDFYLFDRLLGFKGDNLDEQARTFLERLELETKVRVEGGWFSTTALSQGQRKRLALLTAFLEDRLIYVFDEWAADQDVHYREIFYSQLLPELRARGKTVLVISHDDRYYHLGDRVLKLEYGKLVEYGKLISPSPFAEAAAR